MNLSYIKKIIKLVENSSIDELELEEEGTKNKSCTEPQLGDVRTEFQYGTTIWIAGRACALASAGRNGEPCICGCGTGGELS